MAGLRRLLPAGMRKLRSLPKAAATARSNFFLTVQNLVVGPKKELLADGGVPTVLPHEPLHVVPLAQSARLADDRQDRDTDFG